ncbi:MAG: F0F1 ATP synthase subunit epsilon [candidate division Zixibacteria bacterium]|nr:F0F1 ATP synthase subunit epsilon [candidate division Zixibacteria bacterium]
MASFQLSIVTPAETVLDEEVESIIVPGAKGYLGVLANHAPLITPLQPGKMTIRKPGDSHETIMAIAGGFLEVANNVATVLADATEYPKQIDRQRAEEALRRARERIKASEPDIDIGRAMTSAERAKNRMHILDQYT